MSYESFLVSRSGSVVSLSGKKKRQMSLFYVDRAWEIYIVREPSIGSIGVDEVTFGLIDFPEGGLVNARTVGRELLYASTQLGS